MCIILPEEHRVQAPACTPVAATPWRTTYKRHVCQVIKRDLEYYRAAYWPVDSMEAEICYLAHSQMARWRLILLEDEAG